MMRGIQARYTVRTVFNRELTVCHQEDLMEEKQLKEGKRHQPQAKVRRPANNMKRTKQNRNQVSHKDGK